MQCDDEGYLGQAAMKPSDWNWERQGERQTHLVSRFGVRDAKNFTMPLKGRSIKRSGFSKFDYLPIVVYIIFEPQYSNGDVKDSDRSGVPTFTITPPINQTNHRRNTQVL